MGAATPRCRGEPPVLPSPHSQEQEASLRLPVPQDPHGDDRWSVIRYALDSWARTAKLCLILLVMTGGLVVLMVELIQHIR
jgi:hypothetical protein